MEYVQERVPTLHDLTGRVPDAPLSETVVVVPMTGEEYRRDVTRGIFSTLSTVGPKRVIVPLRADAETVPEVGAWLDSTDVATELLWCNSPRVRSILDGRGLDGTTGKGSDVWLALGRAADVGEYVVVHDADIENYGTEHVPRLCAPLTGGFSFTKGYYSRIENNRFYGRLLRLFYEPLTSVVADDHDAPITDYLTAFRYALAGDVGLTAEFARTVRAEPAWGLEVGLLGEAFHHGGVENTVQVDLGNHEHDHRPVDGNAGLSTMSRAVGAALFRVLEEGDVDLDYETLPDRYRRRARSYVERYAADAAFNGLEYDRASERDQIRAYADAIAPPTGDGRLPPWSTVDLDPAQIAAASDDSIVTVVR